MTRSGSKPGGCDIGKIGVGNTSDGDGGAWDDEDAGVSLAGGGIGHGDGEVR